MNLKIRRNKTMKVKDRNGKTLKKGQKVKWYDPEEEARDLSRVYVVDKIHNEDVVMISDEYSEAEVIPHELEII